MWIKKLTLDGFGRFINNFSISFREKGLQLVFGMNESGKSTLITSIFGILFGLKKEETEKYRPWHSETFRGELEFVIKGNTYTVSRDFDSNHVTLRDSDGRILFNDRDTFQGPGGYEYRRILCRDTGLPEENILYASTVVLQRGLEIDTDETLQKLVTGSQDLSYTTISTKLEEDYFRITKENRFGGPDRPSPRELEKIEETIVQLENELEKTRLWLLAAKEIREEQAAIIAELEKARQERRLLVRKEEVIKELLRCFIEYETRSRALAKLEKQKQSLDSLLEEKSRLEAALKAQFGGLVDLPPDFYEEFKKYRNDAIISAEELPLLSRLQDELTRKEEELARVREELNLHYPEIPELPEGVEEKLQMLKAEIKGVTDRQKLLSGIVPEIEALKAELASYPEEYRSREQDWVKLIEQAWEEEIKFNAEIFRLEQEVRSISALMKEADSIEEKIKKQYPEFIGTAPDLEDNLLDMQAHENAMLRAQFEMTPGVASPPGYILSMIFLVTLLGGLLVNTFSGSLKVTLIFSGVVLVFASMIGYAKFKQGQEELARIKESKEAMQKRYDMLLEKLGPYRDSHRNFSFMRRLRDYKALLKMKEELEKKFDRAQATATLSEIEKLKNAQKKIKEKLGVPENVNLEELKESYEAFFRKKALLAELEAKKEEAEKFLAENAAEKNGRIEKLMAELGLKNMEAAFEENLEARLVAARKLQLALRSLEKEIATLKEQVEHGNMRAKEAQERVNDWLARYANLTPEPLKSLEEFEACLESLRAKRSELEKISAALREYPSKEELTGEIARVHSGLQDLEMVTEELRKELPELQVFDADSIGLIQANIEKNLKKNQAILEEIDERKEAVLKRLQSGPAAGGNIAVIKDEIAYLQERHNYLSRRKEVLSLVINALNEAIQEFRSSYLERITIAVRENFTALAGKREEVLYLDSNFKPYFMLGSKRIGIECLSMGARDQLYFAIRSTLAQELGSYTGLPFFMDDPFKEYDHIRFKNVITLMQKIAEDKQVVFFSHDTRYREYISTIHELPGPPNSEATNSSV